MKFTGIFLATMLVAGGGIGLVRAEEAGKYTLRYKFHPGETLRWDVIHRARIATTVSGTTQTAETVSQSVKAWKVIKVAPDGSATFEHMVESVDMSQKLTGAQEVRYNSKTDAKPPYGFQTIAESIGKPLSQVTVSTTGEVVNRQRYPVKQAPENEGQITLPLPAEPVAAGEAWSRPYDVDITMPGGMGKKIKTLQKFNLEEVRDGVATIRMSTVILTPVREPAIEAQLVQRESSGVVRFDIDAGRIIGQQMDVDKQVVGFRGEASSLHYLSRFTEQIVAAQGTTAAVTKDDTARK
jgi:hypothetical protein